MGTRRRHVTSLFPSILIGLTTLAAGCSSGKEGGSPASTTGTGIANASSTVAMSQSPSAVAPESPGVEEAGSADILARKTESYAQSLTPLIDQRKPLPEELQPVEHDASTVAEPRRESVPVQPNPSASSRQTDVRVKPEGATAIASTPPVHSPQVSDSSSPQANQTAAPTAVATAVRKPDPVYTVIKANDAAVPARSEASATPTDDLAAQLAQRIKDDPLDPAAHLEFQLLRFLHREPVPEMSSLASLPQEDQQTLTVLLDGLSNYRSQLHAEQNPLLSRKVKPLLDMADRLRASSDLDIQKLAICREVKAFGVYEPMEPARFVATKDRDYALLVYCEIANFSSQLNERSIWETKLKYSASLFTDTENGIEAWQGKPSDVLDLCRNRRRDFFILDELSLPSTLTIGGYLLKVTIVDEQANRVAEASVPIQIVAR